jgi:transposase
MRQRCETVEHPFGTIEAEMGATHFLTKTLPRVAADMALHVSAYHLTRAMNNLGVQPLLAAMKAQSSQTCVLPAIRPEGLEVRSLVSPRIVIETRPRSALSRPCLSGVSVHRRLALGGLGGFGAGIRRRGVGRRWLDRSRLDIDHATRPAEIVGPSARRRDIFTRAQPNGRPRTFAGSS